MKSRNSYKNDPKEEINFQVIDNLYVHRNNSEKITNNLYSKKHSYKKNKFKTNKNLELNVHECINIENYYKNEDLDLYNKNSNNANLNEKKLIQKIGLHESELIKKRFLSPNQDSEFTKNILKNISDSDYNNNSINFKKNQKNINAKEELINKQNLIEKNNINQYDLVSDLDNDSDQKEKLKDNNPNKKNVIKKTKKSMLKGRKEKFNYGRRRSSQSFSGIEQNKNFIVLRNKYQNKNEKRKNNDCYTNSEEKSFICSHDKRDLFILNFNLTAELDQMEKIETKSKETFLVIIVL